MTDSMTTLVKAVTEKPKRIVEIIKDELRQYEIESKIGEVYLNPYDVKENRNILVPVHARILRKHKIIKISRNGKLETACSENEIYDLWNEYYKDRISWLKFSEGFELKRNPDNIRKKFNATKSLPEKADEAISNVIKLDLSKDEIKQLKKFTMTLSKSILPDLLRILRRHGIVKPWTGLIVPPYIVNGQGYEIYDLRRRFYKGQISWPEFASNFKMKSTPENIRKNFNNKKDGLPVIVLFDIKKYLS